MKISNSIAVAASLIMLFAALVAAGTSGPSPVPAPPGYTLSTNATVLCRGITNYIPITVTNHGSGSIGSMQDVMLSLNNPKGVYSTTLNAGTIPANATDTFEMPVFVYANASLFVPAGITINYYYYVLYTDNEVKNVSFTVRSCPQPLAATVSPKIITAGAIENLTVNITNTGSETLNAISVSMAMPSADAVLLSAQPVEINSIGPHSSIMLNQRVYVSRNASESFPDNLTINYYNGSTLSQASNYTQLLTTGIINITSSSLTLSPSTPSPGSIFSISLVLTNTGTSSASAVTAAIVPTRGFSPYSGNSVFVGSIGADSQVPVTLTLTSSPDTQNGVYSIPIRINYLNSIRQNVSQEITVPVRLAMAGAFNASNLTKAYTTRASGSGLISLLLIIIIIVLLILYYRERKKNRRHVK